MSSTFAMSARTATISLSYLVVVGPWRFSVSLKIAQRSIPAIGMDGRRECVRKVCAMLEIKKNQEIIV